MSRPTPSAQATTRAAIQGLEASITAAITTAARRAHDALQGLELETGEGETPEVFTELTRLIETIAELRRLLERLDETLRPSSMVRRRQPLEDFARRIGIDL